MAERSTGSGVGEISLYATIPPFDSELGASYSGRVDEVSRWSENAGYRGALVYTDNGLLDPWLVANMVIAGTEALRPLVAVQPAYMHPYSVAKLISSLGHIHGRAVDVNWVAGGFVRDLRALGDGTAHDRRYDRIVEYASVVSDLLLGRSVDLDGDFYQVSGLALNPTLDDRLLPQQTLSGSSEAGVAAAVALGATAVQYPEPRLASSAPLGCADQTGSLGIRVGIIAREDEADAWRVARSRFPPDRRGQLVHRLAMAVSDSSWHRQLSNAAKHDFGDSPYWMVPFENYKTFCPYLVGTPERIAAELAEYLRRGCDTIITDVPFSAEESAQVIEIVGVAQSLSTERSGVSA